MKLSLFSTYESSQMLNQKIDQNAQMKTFETNIGLVSLFNGISTYVGYLML